jgi:hypothetical protein
MEPITKREQQSEQNPETPQGQISVDLPINEEGAIETTAQWEVRRSLCLALVCGFSWIYRKPELRKKWAEEKSLDVGEKALSLIVPSCSLKTSSLARAVVKLKAFVTKEGEKKSRLTQIVVAGIVYSCDRSLGHYELYREECQKHGISYTSSGLTIIGFPGD